MAKRSYGTGQLYEKHGAYYGRWRTSDARASSTTRGRRATPRATRNTTRSSSGGSPTTLRCSD
jgi:hypothetical protein